MIRGMIMSGMALFALVLVVAPAYGVNGQGHLRLSPVRGGSKIKLIYGARSVTVDLDDALGNGTMPGDPPHRYRVLFTAEKGGFVYLVANVQSRSPISDKNAPCGGDSPRAILWIKADKTLKTREFDSQIYASCSYNFYDSKLQVKKTGFTAHYGGRELETMKYDNRNPEKGLVVTSMLEPPDRDK
jgi:hypothetical protein